MQTGNEHNKYHDRLPQSDTYGQTFSYTLKTLQRMYILQLTNSDLKNGDFWMGNNNQVRLIWQSHRRRSIWMNKNMKFRPKFVPSTSILVNNALNSKLHCGSLVWIRLILLHDPLCTIPASANCKCVSSNFIVIFFK